MSKKSDEIGLTNFLAITAIEKARMNANKPPAPGKPGPLPPKFTRIELMDFVQWFTEIKPEKGLVADYDGMIEGKSLAISHRRMKQLLAILEEWSDQNSKETK